MKAKKLPLLLALIALIGTFSSVIPQNTFADNNDTTGTCVITQPTVNNDDLHQITITKPSPTEIQVEATVTAVGQRDNINVVLVRLLDGQGNTFQTAPGASADPNADPVIFMASFGPGLPDDEYTIVICYTTGFPNVDDLGTKHGDEGSAIIDTTDPNVSCPPPLEIIPNDFNSIPVNDPRIQQFLNPGADGLPSATDLNPPNPQVTNNNQRTEFAVDSFFDITFSATDDFGNTGQCVARITIGVPPATSGCEGRILDQTGALLEIEICEEVNVRQADCGLGILGNNPTLSYGALNQGDTSTAQSLLVINTGNAPALLKVIAGDPLAVPPTPGAWIDPTEVGAPPFTPEMLAARTHFSTLDPAVVGPDDAAFYDSANSFAVSDTVKKILIPILGPQVVEELFWQLRIILLNPLSFGDFQQTLTLELQQCSLANECEIFGFDCPLTGDPFIENG